MPKRFLLAALLALSACSELTAPDGAVPIDPIPHQYRVWWDELQACSGFRGDLGDVRFFAEPYYEGHRGRARWRGGSHSQIIVAEHMRLDERHLKHEMMHVLGRFTTHPPKYFNGVCGNLTAGISQ